MTRGEGARGGSPPTGDSGIWGWYLRPHVHPFTGWRLWPSEGGLPENPEPHQPLRSPATAPAYQPALWAGEDTHPLFPHTHHRRTYHAFMNTCTHTTDSPQTSHSFPVFTKLFSFYFNVDVTVAQAILKLAIQPSMTLN